MEQCACSLAERVREPVKARHARPETVCITPSTPVAHHRDLRGEFAGLIGVQPLARYHYRPFSLPALYPRIAISNSIAGMLPGNAGMLPGKSND